MMTIRQAYQTAKARLEPLTRRALKIPAQVWLLAGALLFAGLWLQEHDASIRRAAELRQLQQQTATEVSDLHAQSNAAIEVANQRNARMVSDLEAERRKLAGQAERLAALLDAHVSNISMKKGTLSAYSAGVVVSGGDNINVNGVTCETNAYPNFSSGCVTMSLAGNLKAIAVNNVHVGTMTQSGASADVNLASLGGFTLGALSVSNLNDSLLGGAALATVLTNGTTQYLVDGLRTGQSSSIGGSSLGAGVCTTGTASVPGAAVNQAAFATPLTYPGDAIYWRARVTAANTVTVNACAAVAATPTASQYVVKVARRIE
jgi:hypothetical protein